MRFWFRSKNDKMLEESALSLYRFAVEESRRPHLYTDLGLPDTVDGRFDALVLHLGLVLARLAEAGRDTGAEGADKGVKRAADLLAREISSLFVAQMDATVREMGVGDLSVGKHVKRMSKALYGRTLAYHAVLSGEGDEELGEALVRNVWAGEAPTDQSKVAALSGRTTALWKALAATPLEDMLAGKVSGHISGIRNGLEPDMAASMKAKKEPSNG